MKPILLVIIAFVLSSGNVFAQQYDGIKLSTDKPEAGQKISFVYTGIFAKKIDPRINIYYEINGGLRWKLLDLKHNGAQIEGSFTVPDSALAFSIKPDNNLASSEIFIFNVFKDGKEAKGALIASAMLYTCGIYDNRNYKKAYELYNQEFLRYPDLKPKNLLGYYQSVYSPYFFPNPAISEELEKTWADSLANGKSEEFLTRLADLRMRIGNSLDPQIIKKEVLTKYPNGALAFNDDVKDLSAKIKSGDFATALTAIEIKYGPQVKKGGLDFVYLNLGQKQFITNNTSGGEDYLLKIQSKQVKKELYLFAGKLLLKNNWDLQKAEKYIQQAIVLVTYDKQPYYVFDKKNWQKSLDGYRGTYLDISAQIQYQSGNKPGAIERLKTALQINDYDESIKEHYIQYLLEADQAKEALTTASGYVIKQKATDAIKKMLRDAYLKDKGNAVGYDAYYSDLLKKADEQYTLPEFGQFNVPCIDFTITGTDNKSVSLSVYKGKPIVLYFFSMDYNTPQQDAFNASFNKIVNAHQGSNIVFLAIDKTSVSETDEVNGKPLRIQKVNKFLSDNGFNFKVLLDDFHRDPISTSGSYYAVSKLYSSDSSCQFYVIDKNGIVRYKSFPYSPMPVEQFTRELTAALRLVK